MKRKLIPWITIQDGQVNVEELRAKLQFDLYARGMFNDIEFKPLSEANVDFVRLSPEDLGFSTDPTTEEFINEAFIAEWSAQNLNGQVLKFCQPRHAPMLRAENKDQIQFSVVATHMLLNEWGKDSLFVIERTVLTSQGVIPRMKWGTKTLAIFVLESVT